MATCETMNVIFPIYSHYGHFGVFQIIHWEDSSFINLDKNLCSQCLPFMSLVYEQPAIKKLKFIWFCRQTRFVLPGPAGSPPKILTFDEVRDAIKNVEDMQLAHEIAINPDFRLQPYDPPESSLEKRIKRIMHDAFWDLLREQLNADPPVYDHAIALLGDLKEVYRI